MAADKNLSQMAEIDFCLRKYYNENMASVLSSVIKEVNQKKAEELARIDRETSPIVGAGSAMPDARGFFVLQRAKMSEWGSKTTDDMMGMAVERMFKDLSVQHDMFILEQAWKIKIIQKIGEEKYLELSGKSVTGDLARDLVRTRISDLMIEQMARSNVPKSSLDYIVKKGLGDSLVGLMSKMYVNSSPSDVQVKEMVDKLYDPSTGERITGTALSFLIDSPTLMLGGGSKLAIGGVAALDGAVRAYDSYDEYKKARKELYPEFSRLMFDDEQGFSHVADESRKVKAQDSDVVDYLNSKFTKKMRMSFNNGHVASDTRDFVSLSESSGSKALELMRENLKAQGLAYLPQKGVPNWMKVKMNEGTCIKNAGYFLALASEMQSKGRTKMKVGSQEFTLKEATQRAYDYARAANWFHEKNGLTENEKLEQRLDQGEAELRAMGLLPDNQKKVRDVTDSAILQNIRASLHKNGLAYVPDHQPPSWMAAMSQEDLEKNAKNWRNVAVRMQSEKKTEQTFKGVGRMTLQEVTQRAYDYATAADLKFKAAREEKIAARESKESLQQDMDQWDRDMAALNASLEQPSTVQQQDPNIHQSVMVQEGGQPQQTAQAQSVPVSQQTVQQSQVIQPTQQNMQGWNSFFDQLGLGGLSHFGNGMGETLSMLPELVAGLFTGKIKNFRMEDNLLPLGMLMAGLFVNKRSHPILKLLLVALGGMLLLGNANDAVHGRERSQAQVKPTYRKYEDEPLNPRIKDPHIKGNTILAEIDGHHLVLTINQDEVIDAYRKGAIPLNTLCNSALRSYDEQGGWTAQNYEREISRQQEMEEERVRGIR